MATSPPADLSLAPLTGKPRMVEEWLTMFDLAFVAIDPFTNESAWLLETAARVLSVFEDADVRVAWVVTGDPDECRMFLGPWAERVLTFADADRAVIRAFGLQRLPALVWVGMDGTVLDAAEGWEPSEWRRVVHGLARKMSWTAPDLPLRGDPGPFAGSPASG